MLLVNYPPDWDKPRLYPDFYGDDERGRMDIILGVQTNILCVDDRLEPEHIIGENDTISDFTATLYLGKITFKKNKQGNLAPIYIPSTITESSFEGLNTFWLNEINPHPKKPFRSMMQCEMIMEAYRQAIEEEYRFFSFGDSMLIF